MVFPCTTAPCLLPGQKFLFISYKHALLPCNPFAWLRLHLALNAFRTEPTSLLEATGRYGPQIFWLRRCYISRKPKFKTLCQVTAQDRGPERVSFKGFLVRVSAKSASDVLVREAITEYLCLCILGSAPLPESFGRHGTEPKAHPNLSFWPTSPNKTQHLCMHGVRCVAPNILLCHFTVQSSKACPALTVASSIKQK